MLRFKKIMEWLTSAGFTFLFFTLIYNYLSGSINVVFVKSIKNQYEFYLENNSPFDRVIERFRIQVPKEQRIIFKITENIPATETPKGIIFAGGNDVYIPAVESHDIDGKIIRSGSKEKIIIPPVASRRWLEPEAFMASITFISKPKNYFINIIETILSACHIKGQIFHQYYVIIHNYWKSTQSKDPEEAVRMFCRYDNSLDMKSLCEK